MLNVDQIIKASREMSERFAKIASEVQVSKSSIKSHETNVAKLEAIENDSIANVTITIQQNSGPTNNVGLSESMRSSAILLCISNEMQEIERHKQLVEAYGKEFVRLMKAIEGLDHDASQTADDEPEMRHGSRTGEPART